MQVTTSTDHAFKLFGKSISLPPDVQSPSIISGENSLEEEEEGIVEKDCSAENATKTTKEVDAPTANSEEPADTAGATGSDVHPLTPSINEEPANLEGSKSEKEQNDVTSSQEKTALKKPDKILPCPRCNSMDTKFCYYNNYNTNQPRHFCRACQRYWTAGGTMRNVPVGAGRRKNKNSASHYRHITISDALQVAHIDLSNGTQHPMLKRNGRVLSFGVSDSMVSVLNLADKKATNPAQNGFHTLDEQRFTVPCKGEKGDDCSSVSSVTVSNSTERGGRTCSKETCKPSVNGFESQIPCLPNVPWPYPWNSTLPPVAPQAFCPPGLPLSFYPSAYWNCSVMGTWNTSLPSPQSSSSVSQKTACCKPTSPAVGKHSRESNPTKPDDSEKEEPPKKKNGCVLVPKTLRIDDPSEAAKSSIWTTLGINNDATNGISLLKAFQPKTSEKNHLIETSMVLQANPAALSRSINFLENS